MPVLYISPFFIASETTFDTGSLCGIMVTMNDIFYMKRALNLAKKAIGYTSPNPLVGAVLVKNRKIIAEGYHKKAGLPHAEAEVISVATENIAGSTLYVTLEPCCHTDKRTPPCTKTIISSKIKRVVIAMIDPNPKVSGTGIRLLKDGGIDVQVGVLANEAQKLNEFYVKYIKTGIPFVILKTAMTLDGKTATPQGESKWISSEESRRLVHRLRGVVDAVLTGSGTVRADNPRFTTRIKGLRDPLRIIIDPDLAIPDGYHVLDMPPQTLIVTRSRNSRVQKLKERGIGIIPYSGDLDLQSLMATLAKRGIISLLIEGGATLASHALNAGIVDKVMYFVAPKIIGGRESYPAVGGTSYRTIEDALRVENIRVRRIGEDILIEGYPKK